MKYGASMERLLCFFVHPNHFESITSEDMKRQILKGFADRVSEPSGDTDRALYELRGRLTSKYGPDFQFYDPAVRQVWDPTAQSAAADSPVPTFFKWCRRILESEGFEESEVAYKRHIAARTALAREALLAGRPEWPGLLRDSLKHRENNLLNWRVVGRMAAWLEAEPEAAGRALKSLWSEGAIRGRLEAFEAVLPETVTASAGSRASVASFLLMGVDVRSWPIYRPGVFHRAYSLSGHGGEPAKSDSAQRYLSACNFLDWMTGSAERHGVRIPDWLHAQSILYAFPTTPRAVHVAPVPRTTRAWRPRCPAPSGAGREKIAIVFLVMVTVVLFVVLMLKVWWIPISPPPGVSSRRWFDDVFCQRAKGRLGFRSSFRVQFS